MRTIPHIEQEFKASVTRKLASLNRIHAPACSCARFKDRAGIVRVHDLYAGACDLALSANKLRRTQTTSWWALDEAPEWIARQLGHTSTEMLFRVYSRYVPNLTRQDGSAMERLLASRMSTGANVQPSNPAVPAKVLPQLVHPKLRGITGGRAIGQKSGRTNALPDYFGDAEPQPPPQWQRTAMAPACWPALT